MYISYAIIHPCQTCPVEPGTRRLQAGRTQVAWELVAGRTKLEGVASATQTDCQQGAEASRNRPGGWALQVMYICITWCKLYIANVIFLGRFVYYIICFCSFFGFM
jgi:hypothetical protein